MSDDIERAATWKRVTAFFLDLCMVGFGGGYLIALATGETTGRGFYLPGTSTGTSTLALWALILLYFFLGRRYAGGTLWDRILRIRRPQPDDVGMARIASDQPVGVRAGFWRRLLAFSIDSIIVSALFQLMVAVLFVATSGRIQIYGDVTHMNCAKLAKVPDGLAPPPPAGSNAARECNFYFFGAQTARILQVGRVAKEGTATTTASKNYMLDRDGHPIDGMSVDWIAILALIAYLLAMETRTGATLGSRAMGIRVIDAAAPVGPGVPLRKIVLRYLVMLIGFLPSLAVLLIYFGFYGSLDELNMLLLKSSRGDSFIVDVGSRTAFEWHPTLSAYLFNLNLTGILPGDGSPPLDELEWLFDFADLVLKGWAIFLVVQIARKRDPLYDKMAGTAVVRASHDHQHGDRAGLGGIRGDAPTRQQSKLSRRHHRHDPGRELIAFPRFQHVHNITNSWV